MSSSGTQDECWERVLEAATNPKGAWLEGLSEENRLQAYREGWLPGSRVKKKKTEPTEKQRETAANKWKGSSLVDPGNMADDEGDLERYGTSERGMLLETSDDEELWREVQEIKTEEERQSKYSDVVWKQEDEAALNYEHEIQPSAGAAEPGACNCTLSDIDKEIQTTEEALMTAIDDEISKTEDQLAEARWKEEQRRKWREYKRRSKAKKEADAMAQFRAYLDEFDDAYVAGKTEC